MFGNLNSVSPTTDADNLRKFVDKYAGFHRGDIDNNDIIDLRDLVRLQRFLHSGGPGPVPFKHLGDVNNDGLVGTIPTAIPCQRTSSTVVHRRRVRSCFNSRLNPVEIDRARVSRPSLFFCAYSFLRYPGPWAGRCPGHLGPLLLPTNVRFHGVFSAPPLVSVPDSGRNCSDSGCSKKPCRSSPARRASYTHRSRPRAPTLAAETLCGFLNSPERPDHSGGRGVTNCVVIHDIVFHLGTMIAVIR